MRAYFIRITKKDNPNNVLALYTSFKPDGTTNGAALQVEWDIPGYVYGTPAGGATAKIYGVNFDDIRQSSDWNDADVTIYGGMAKGLELANPKQAGILFQGTIFQCFGNALGTETSLNLIMYPKGGTNESPVNLSFQWTKGATLESAARQVLAIAFPGSSITGGWSDSLVYTEDQPMVYKTLPQFAQRVDETSHAIIPATTYIGAQIRPTPAGFDLFDGTKLPTAKPIQFVDLIGQPTWLDPGTLQFSTVMRADLSVGDVISLPQGSNVINTPNSFTRGRQKTAFTGRYQIKNIRHVGNYRQNSAMAWVTIIDCYDAPSS